MPQPWLPADLLEAQLSTIDLLTAMFPSPGEIEFPDSTTPACITKLREWCETASNSPTPFPTGISSSILLAVHAPVADGTKTIQVNISIPLQSVDPSQQPPLSYSLRQPDWMTKAQVGQLAAEMPSDDIFEALEYLREEATRFLETQQKSTSTSTPTGNPTKTDSAPIVRVWFYFPSLSTREKRNDMVHNAPDYGLTGFVLAGKPGVLCLEGASREIDAYMSFIKTHSWGDIPSHQKKVSERYRETGEVRRVFGGMEEITDSLGERGGQRANRGDMQALEAWLRERGLHEAFDKVIF
ncbi:ubiquitin-conjugating enzyme/RWD-like protein [Aspergillus egyptiacus]|nr:ubiquitin-conjugating enzyme/RWD-like protein [Aspergillus egyptiacus]